MSTNITPDPEKKRVVKRGRSVKPQAEPEMAPEPEVESSIEESTPDEEEPTNDPYIDDEEDDTPLNLEDLDPNQELWPEGPTVKQVLDFKEQFDDVYVTTFPVDRHFLWKTLDRGEYRMVVRRVEEVTQSGEMTPSEANMLQEELVCELCLLFPRMSGDDFVKGMAGIPSLLSQQILESSGFVALDTRGL